MVRLLLKLLGGVTNLRNRWRLIMTMTTQKIQRFAGIVQDSSTRRIAKIEKVRRNLGVLKGMIAELEASCILCNGDEEKISRMEKDMQRINSKIAEATVELTYG